VIVVVELMVNMVVLVAPDAAADAIAQFSIAAAKMATFACESADGESVVVTVVVNAVAGAVKEEETGEAGTGGEGDARPATTNRHGRG